ncbi:Rieske (2Fe-2S) protein [Cohnella nanjingensis]|uniref:Rieske (2Fe-2S) protein n=1 Tax=Cohnella nanjingensis TaxID=1387779 RepID=A0A7X0RNT0_9BACL|nr:Rieske (2Fe-2S) protein [Cohnella nanjingensis]MBB6669645.1 Rieske (2Fe-2S) protein [Cohnella nanjingensis]
MSETIIGPADQFTVWPAEVELDGAPYWLTRSEAGEYRLLLAVCPHAGGEVRWTEGTFFCPLHFWTFDREDGHCTNVDDERLQRRDVTLREDGVLVAAGELY